MTNQDIGLGPYQNSRLEPMDRLELDHDHNFGVAHSQCHDEGLEMNDDLSFGSTEENELDLTTFSTRHECEMASQHPHDESRRGNDEELDEGVEHAANQHSNDSEKCDDKLALSSRTFQLNFLENDNFSEKLEYSFAQNLDMAIVPVSDTGHMANAQQFDMFTPPVLQSRPTHDLDYDKLLYVGQVFADVHSCRRGLRDAAIAFRFEMQTVKSDKTRFTAKCASQGCPWRIHAAKLPGVPTFTIRTIHDQHTCAGLTHLGHQQASVQWVADSIEHHLRENPNCTPKEILEKIHRVYGIALSYKQAWRGKERIMASVRGSFEEDFRLLPQYCDQIRRSNPGSIASVYGNTDDHCFQCLFISYQACIYGFLNGCRRLIGLDRVPLKSKYLGTLLIATGVDGDGALYPLAFGVVDEETDDSWMWFLSEIRNLLEVNAEYMPMLTILSDRRESLVSAVEANFPAAFHGFCMHYISESFQKEFNNAECIGILWEAACALTAPEFESKIYKIEQLSSEAAAWIRRLPSHLWATAYFQGARFGHMTASITESLKTLIADAAHLPIIQLMESTRRCLMTWFTERREACKEWSNILVPYAETHVSLAIEYARNYQVHRVDGAEFEVLSHMGSCTVDVRTRQCTCRGWQLCGLPCSHAVAALLSCRQNVNRFTESCFTVTNYRKAYSESIHPVPDKSMWHPYEQICEGDYASRNQVVAVINPPKSLRPPGKPRKRRVSPADDSGRVKRVVHCSRCNQAGHFRTTCTAPV